MTDRTDRSSTATIDLPLTGKLDKIESSLDFQFSRYAALLTFNQWLADNGPHSPLVHILDNDSLLNIFSFSRPVIVDGGSEVNVTQILGGGDWDQERWWYRLIQVCRRWRYLVLESAFHLRISLVCARGTPVADMLAHSPPVPLIINHFHNFHDITAEDEEGIIFALQHRDRVRRIRLVKPIPILKKLIDSLCGEFPFLEYLLIMHQQDRRPRSEHNTHLTLPETFRAPHLRQLVLMNFVIQIKSPLLTNLTTLSLNLIPASAYFHPNALLQRLSLMPQLETLGICFNTYYPCRDVEQQLLHTPITTHVTLPNLRWLGFQGTTAYLEALLPRVTIPLLERLQVYFFNRLIYSIPHLQQTMSAAGNLLFKSAKFYFRDDHLEVRAYSHKGAKMYTLSMELGGKHLDWQVVSAGQVFCALREAFSTVEDLTLVYERYVMPSSEWNNEAERTRWRELLGSFGNVKTLHVYTELVGQLAHALQPGEGESSTDLLPELQELLHSATGVLYNAFSEFIDARQKAGCPVTLINL